MPQAPANTRPVTHLTSARVGSVNRNFGRFSGPSCIKQDPLVSTQAVADLREGWAYMVAPGNRDVAAFTLIKASSALVWGASDVLYVK
jgi:hypothetical protein